MSHENILVETRGRVGIIRLNRPQALNALNSALNTELGRALAAFDEAADRYEDLGRPRDQARCLARMGRNG